MALIQDIIPSGKKPSYRSPRKVVVTPRTMEPVKSFYPPSHQPTTTTGRYQTYPKNLLAPTANTEQYRIIPPLVTRKFKIRVKIFLFLKYLLVAIVVLGAGGSLAVGQVIIGIYFILAVIFKISTRLSFLLALALLVCTPLLDLVGQTGISANAVIYAFELLVIGTVQSSIEIWKTRK